MPLHKSAAHALVRPAGAAQAHAAAASSADARGAQCADEALRIVQTQ